MREERSQERVKEERRVERHSDQAAESTPAEKQHRDRGFNHSLPLLV